MHIIYTILSIQSYMTDVWEDLRKQPKTTKTTKRSLIADVNTAAASNLSFMKLHTVCAASTSQQADLHKLLWESFISGESGSLLVLDNVTVKCNVLLLLGQRCWFCPSRRTPWQTGRRGPEHTGTEWWWRVGTSWEGRERRGGLGVWLGIVADLCDLTSSVDGYCDWLSRLPRPWMIMWLYVT